MNATQEQLDLDCQMAEWGQAVTVYTSPGDTVGRPCTGIVTYGVIRSDEDPPRPPVNAITIKLVNSAMLGIAASEANGKFEALIPTLPGGSPVRKRIGKAIAAGRFGTWITWEIR